MALHNLPKYDFFQMDWCFDNRPYDLILPGLCMPDFESSHIGLIISWADNCIAIEVANQKLGPSPACKPKLQQAGIYYLVYSYCIHSEDNIVGSISFPAEADFLNWPSPWNDSSFSKNFAFIAAILHISIFLSKGYGLTFSAFGSLFQWNIIAYWRLHWKHFPSSCSSILKISSGSWLLRLQL